MDTAFRANLGKFVIRILVICMLTNWFVLGIYFWKFGPGNWFELSSSHEIWAHFGTFYSGLLGPFLSFLAFIGILFTVLIQVKQFDLVKQQSEIEELQRVLSSVSAQLDQMLNVTPSYYAANAHVLTNGPPLTLLNHITGLGHGKLFPSEEHNSEHALKVLSDVKQDISMSLNSVAMELHCLSWALQKYKGAGGKDSVVEFYKFRYEGIVTYLDALNAIHKTSRIRDVFDLVSLKESMTQAAV